VHKHSTHRSSKRPVKITEKMITVQYALRCTALDPSNHGLIEALPAANTKHRYG
jgi:hypothetical protein